MVISIQELRKMERQREQAEQNAQRPKRFPWQSQAKSETVEEPTLRFARFFYEQ